jgi:hypothetical protein
MPIFHGSGQRIERRRLARFHEIGAGQGEKSLHSARHLVARPRGVPLRFDIPGDEE